MDQHSGGDRVTQGTSGMTFSRRTIAIGLKRRGIDHRILKGVFVLAITIPALSGRASGDEADGRLEPLDHWPAAASASARALSAKPAVILVPGMLAGERSMIALRKRLSDSVIPAAIYRYDSAIGVERAAVGLAQSLIDHTQRQPDLKLVMVTHSMGGLVARRVLESPKWKVDKVRRLIMVAPPNAGSSIASLDAQELHRTLSGFTGERGRSFIGEGEIKLLDEFVGQFLGSAKEDLRPGSEVLRQLQQCQRNPEVRYSIIAGSGGPVPQWVRSLGQVFVAKQLFERPAQAEQIKRVYDLANRDEWINGLGDGVVTTQSTRLPGVTDHQELEFGHNDITFASESAETRKLVEAIMTRLEK